MDMNSKIYSNEEDSDVSFPMRKYVLLLRRNEQREEKKNRIRFARGYRTVCLAISHYELFAIHIS